MFAFLDLNRRDDFLSYETVYTSMLTENCPTEADQGRSSSPTLLQNFDGDMRMQAASNGHE